MRENFVLSLGFTLGFEGGYVNHPDDPGGYTNKGITPSRAIRLPPASTARPSTMASIPALQPPGRASWP
ncbi:glycosyl hydrolase 108 family protein [Aliihoeflea sp. 2WW]|uniref:glycosyl hydrolase 108 family protein n=1 Tax=Aliihoeflea sp. 2WW TaxID=1381123 RepID=UPI0004B745B8|nr:glycosyl hydrolase 108 family protein [Aliihoeflea sp. 2WW]